MADLPFSETQITRRTSTGAFYPCFTSDIPDVFFAFSHEGAGGEGAAQHRSFRGPSAEPGAAEPGAEPGVS